ncbi:hypothetical protein [Oryzihumus sp.]
MGAADDINALIDEQLGLVSLAQLRTHQASESALRWRLGRSWRMAMPGVLQTFTGPLDERRQLLAAALYAGPEAALTGSGALTWYGLPSCARDLRLWFVTPRRCGERSFGRVAVRRSVLVDPQVRSDLCLRISSPARAAIDTARRLPTQDRVDAVVIEAVQRRVVTLPDLSHWLALGGTLGRRKAQRAIETAATGVWSVPEAELLSLLATSPVLPEVWANPRLTSARGVALLTPDGWLDDVAMALMVHSRQHHFDVEEWESPWPETAGMPNTESPASPSPRG